MVKHRPVDLDLVFAALSDATRRSVIEQLGSGGATVSELAQPHGMSLPGFMKHLAVLEAAGLIARAKLGRVVCCELDAKPMQSAAQWMARYERFWNGQLDALGLYLQHEDKEARWKPTSSKRPPRSASTGTTPAPSKRSGTRGPTRTR